MAMRILTHAIATLVLTACVTGDDGPTADVPPGDPATVLPQVEPDGMGNPVPSTSPGWVNQRPIPVADAARTIEDQVVKLGIAQLLANDSDPDGGRVLFAGLGAMRGGHAAVAAGIITFTPAPDHTGPAWFDYVVSDGRLMANARVTVAIDPVNDLPVAHGAQLAMTAGAGVNFRLDVVDVDGDALTVDVVEPPAHGVLTGDTDKYRYQPAPGWSGVDHLTYRVADGQAWSDPVAISFVVSPRPAVCGDGEIGVPTTTSLEISWLAVSCAGPGDLIVAIDGDPIATVAAAGSDCTCTPGIRSLVVDDPAILARVGAASVFTVAARDASLAWAVVTVHQGQLATDVVVFDEGGGGDALARTADICYAWSRPEVQASAGGVFAEACDDGNAADGDGCSAGCRVE